MDGIDQLLRETMTEFWGKNSLGQKYEVIRQALEDAFDAGDAAGWDRATEYYRTGGSFK